MQLNIISPNLQENLVTSKVKLYAKNGVMISLSRHEHYLASIKNSIITAESTSNKIHMFFVYKSTSHIFENKTIIYSQFCLKIIKETLEEISSKINFFEREIINSDKLFNKTYCNFYLECLSILQSQLKN